MEDGIQASTVSIWVPVGRRKEGVFDHLSLVLLTFKTGQGKRTKASWDFVEGSGRTAVVFHLGPSPSCTTSSRGAHKLFGRGKGLSVRLELSSVK